MKHATKFLLADLSSDFARTTSNHSPQSDVRQNKLEPMAALAEPD